MITDIICMQGLNQLDSMLEGNDPKISYVLNRRFKMNTRNSSPLEIFNESQQSAAVVNLTK